MKKGVKKLKLAKDAVIAPNWKRILAFIIDYLIIDLVVLAPFKLHIERLVPTGSPWTATPSPVVASEMIFIAGIVLVLIMAYFTFLEFFLKQTPGKMLFNLYVVSEVKKELGFWRILLSNFTFFPLIPIVAVLWIVDPLTMLFSAKHQRMLEKLTKIMVVEMRGFKVK
ncbi:RDD family protein [Candidatus Woesearchaeota archaeon]|nr:RDD family protein [Candidatus Woesearchaeota archaeon]